MSAIWPVAMHDRSRMPELQPDLETETVHAVERMTMPAAEVTLFGMSGKPGVHTLGESRTPRRQVRLECSWLDAARPTRAELGFARFLHSSHKAEMGAASRRSPKGRTSLPA